VVLPFHTERIRQRGVALLVAGVDVNAGLRQPSHHRHFVLLGGPPIAHNRRMQGRITGRVLGVYIGTGREQDCDGAGRPVLRRGRAAQGTRRAPRRPGTTAPLYAECADLTEDTTGRDLQEIDHQSCNSSAAAHAENNLRPCHFTRHLRASDGLFHPTP